MSARPDPPCPYCGRTETVQRQTPDGLTIWCYYCGSTGPTAEDPGEACPTRFEGAWKLWRTRRGPSALAALTPAGV